MPTLQKTALRPLATELEFTRVYRENRDVHPAIREWRCLEVLLPAFFQAMKPGDLFAGRIRHPLCGFSTQPGGFGYYCHEAAIRNVLESAPADAALREHVEAMLAFWRVENTTAKTRAAYPPWVSQALPVDSLAIVHPAYPLYRLGGTQLDYGRLLALGIPGMKAEVSRNFEGAEGDGAALGEALCGCLDLLADVARRYAGEIRDAGSATGEVRSLAEALESLPNRPPRTFREAAQLFWLASWAAGSWNYGRLDEVLGPFLARDLDAGLLDEAAATDLLVSLWKLMDATVPCWDARIIVGGKGRENEEAGDRFALLAMEATRRARVIVPQLTLRFHDGQNPALMAKALDVLAEGVTFPMLYNDEVNIPAAAKAMGISEAEAVGYLPFGCGEYMLWKKGFATPSGAINLAKCLEIALNDGRCPKSGKVMGPRTGEAASFASFEDLWRAYAAQVEYSVAALAAQEKIEYETLGREASCLFTTLLTDDCLSRRKAALRGGVRYLAGTLETYGNTDVADALTAIRAAVFENKTEAMESLLTAMRNDWEGAGGLRKRLLALPKYGNDDDVADAMAARVHDHVCGFTRDQAAVVGLAYYLVVVINNSMNVALGKMVGALPDGRKAGDPLANGNNPVAGRDRQGVTAFLNSLVKLRTDHHAGAVQNMKFSKSMFTAHRPKLEALLSGYFAAGGAQAMLTVVNRGDLEAAMREPEKWGHLMVRVGGFSARFVELPNDVQRHILERTLNE